MRFGDLVGAVNAVGARARLLDAGEDSEGRTRTDAGDAQQLPAVGDFLADRTQEVHTLQVQVLGHAQTEAVGHIERRRAFLRVRVVGVLRKALGNRSSRAGTADHLLVSSIDLPQV